MKKLYSLILMALVAVSANAQVVLTYKGETVDPSKTLSVEAEVENYGDETDPFYVVECGVNEPKVANLGSSSADFTVIVDAGDNYTHFSWCGITTSCAPLKAATETREGSLGAGKSTNLVFDVRDAEYGEFFKYSTTVTIKEGSKTTVYNVDFVYADGENGINNVTANTANSTIFDLTGRAVKNPMNGQIYIQNGRKYIQK